LVFRRPGLEPGSGSLGVPGFFSREMLKNDGYSKNKRGEDDLTDLIILKYSNIIERICSQYLHISDVYVYNFTFIYIHIFVKNWEIIVFVSMLFFKRRNGMLDPNDKCLFFGRVETTNQNISYHSPNSWNIASTQYIGKVDLG